MNNKKISMLFNIAVMIYLFFCIGAIELFEPIKEERVFFDIFFDSVHPVVGFSVVIFLVLSVVILGALIVKVFWNRLISDISKLRNINFQEALAISLILGCIGI